MAHQSPNNPKSDHKSEPLRNVQQGFNSGYDAATDAERGDQTADESEARTNALNPVKPRPTPGDGIDQPNAQPGRRKKA